MVESSASEATPSPRLSLVTPIYNEASHLEEWCRSLLGFDFGVPVEYVFVDDCSTDSSHEILQRFADRPGVRLFRQPSNQGKGAALAVGLGHTRGEVVIIQDADFEYAFADVPAVIKPILDDEADVVFGSRYKNSQTVHRTFHYAVNRALTLVSNIASGLYLTDMETCYKAFRGDLIRGVGIQSPRFGFEPEITAKVARLNVRVAEVPIRYFPRTYLEGKKIRWTDGLAALWHVARFNLDTSATLKALEGVPAKYRTNTRRWL